MSADSVSELNSSDKLILSFKVLMSPVLEACAITIMESFSPPCPDDDSLAFPNTIS